MLNRRTQSAQGEFSFPGTGETGHLMEGNKGAYQLHTLTMMPDWITYDLPRTYLTTAESLDLNAYTLKALANHRQPRDDVTGGYLKLTAERLRAPAQQVEDKLLKLAGVKQGAEVLKFPRAREKGTKKILQPV